MYEFTQKQMEKLKTEASHYLNSDKDIRSTLKDMYCDFYPDKTEDIGFVMADRTLEIVGEYHQDISDATEDTEAWLERKVQATVDDKTTLVDRCNALYRARLAMTVSDIHANDGEEAAESYQAEYENKVFTESEVTDELEQKLREELKDAIRNNKVLVGAMNTFSQNIEADDEERKATVAFGEDATNFKAMLTMQAYLQSGEDGCLEGIFPQNTSLRNIAYSVCAATDTMSTTQAVEDGEITQEQGIDILNIIGNVLGAVICIEFAATVGLLVAGLFSVGIPALIAGLFITWKLCDVFLDSFMEGGVLTVETAKDVVVFGAKLVVSIGKKLINGTKKLVKGICSLFGGKSTSKYTVPEHDRANDDVSEKTFTAQPARA